MFAKKAITAFLYAFPAVNFNFLFKGEASEKPLRPLFRPTFVHFWPTF
jgi:hypothetical protein